MDESSHPPVDVNETTDQSTQNGAHDSTHSTEGAIPEDENSSTHSFTIRSRHFAVMVGLLLAGTVCAIGHQIFYSQIEGQPIDTYLIPQNWVIRIGNGIAFLFKTILVATIGVAYSQVFWFRVRSRAIRVRTIDALLSMLNDPLAFVKAVMHANGSLLLLIAAISWLLPLTAIFSPGALTGQFFSQWQNLMFSCSSKYNIEWQLLHSRSHSSHK